MNDKVWNYIKQYHTIAVTEMQRTGIPASITLAQGLLESGIGESRLAKQGNNHFGIKCHNWQGPSMRHNDDKPNECFRVYASAYESYIDHSDFLKNRDRYNSLFQYAANDYVNWAKGLKACGYATNPKYADLLIERIEKYYLSIFDKDNWQDLFNMVSLNRQLSQGDAEVETTTTYYGNELPVATAPVTVYQTPKAANAEPAIAHSETAITKPAIRQNEGQEKKDIEANSKETSAINNIKTLQERELTNTKEDVSMLPTFTMKTVNGKAVINYNLPINLLQVSRDYGISIKKLMDYNEVNADYMFTANNNIFIQKKRKRYKGKKIKHKIKPGERLHNVAQRYGIALKQLKKINGFIGNAAPKAGTFIKLKRKFSIFGWMKRG